MQIVFTPINAFKETFFHLTAFKAYGQIKVLRIDICLIPLNVIIQSLVRFFIGLDQSRPTASKA